MELCKSLSKKKTDKEEFCIKCSHLLICFVRQDQRNERCWLHPLERVHGWCIVTLNKKAVYLLRFKLAATSRQQLKMAANQ